MVRSVWKVKNIFFRKNNKQKKFKIYNSNFLITQDLVSFIFFVYIGNKYKKIIITDMHVGVLLSSLLITRINNGFIHIKDNKKKK